MQKKKAAPSLKVFLEWNKKKCKRFQQTFEKNEFLTATSIAGGFAGFSTYCKEKSSLLPEMH